MSIISKEKFITQYSKALKEGHAAVFIGAGLSISSGYVDWRRLLEPFATELGLNIEIEHNLALLAQFYRNEKGNRTSINKEIVEQFSKDAELNENIKLITKLPIYSYWTTNYDHLIEDGLRINERKADIKVEADQLAQYKRDSDAIVYKMHGDADFPSKAVLTKQDYEVFDKERGLFTTILQGDLVSKTFLFVGFSFEDPNLEKILSRTRNLLGENIGESYWIEKKVQVLDLSTAMSDEERQRLLREKTIDETRQTLKIKELQRYGISTILIDDYTEITEILHELDQQQLLENIFISGSIEFYDDTWDVKKVNDFCSNLANKLVKNKLKIFTGFGLGVGSSVINGALDEIYSKKYKQVDDSIVLRPFPQFISDTSERERRWREYREDFITDVGIAIFVFGNKKDENGKSQLANGVMEEFKIAKQLGKVIIPIGSTGGMASVILEEIEKEIDNYSYLKEYVMELKNETDIDKLVTIILKIIKEVKGD